MANKSVHIKICGMKFPENILETSQLQPDFMGFIFYEKSPRNLDAKIPEVSNEIKKVGVFVNPAYEEVQEKIEKYDLDVVQLHGNETPEFCQMIENNLTKVIKAFSVDNSFDFSILDNYKNQCSYFLFDTKGESFGGNGIPFDWSILKKYTLEKPYFLSGGISLENTEKLFDFFKEDYSKNCFAIDINSKFEISPGLKDIAKLKEFKQLLK